MSWFSTHYILFIHYFREFAFYLPLGKCVFSKENINFKDVILEMYYKETVNSGHCTANSSLDKMCCEPPLTFRVK